MSQLRVPKGLRRVTAQPAAPWGQSEHKAESYGLTPPWFHTHCDGGEDSRTQVPREDRGQREDKQQCLSGPMQREVSVMFC